MATDKILKIKNTLGSSDHYYHFLLGLVLPLLLRADGEVGGTLHMVRSCGPLDGHLHALGISDIRLLSRRDWLDISDARSMDVSILQALDKPETFDTARFACVRAIVMQRLGIEEPERGDEILFINRGRSPDYYQAADTEHPRSANLRRSVPNMAQLADLAREAGLKARVVELENASLRDQVSMFAAARVVVAQHGAALANVIWMQPGGAVLEINPLPESQRFRDLFEILCVVCKQYHRPVAQAHVHAAVLGSEFLYALSRVKKAFFV